MPQTTSDTTVPRRSLNRKLRLVVGITAAFGPLFLFVILINEAWWIAPRVGLSETFVSSNLRRIVAIGLLGSFAVSKLLIALTKRAFPPSRTAE
jgi:hypothetical protein